jgi:hypothetical protein
MPRTAQPSIARPRSTARWSSTAREARSALDDDPRIFRSQTCLRPLRSGRVGITSGAGSEPSPACVIVVRAGVIAARSAILLLVLMRTPEAES